MTATITNVEAFGFNDNGKVKRERRDPDRVRANQRFSNMKPNRLLITGTNLNELDIRNLHITYRTTGSPHTFAVIDKQVVPESSNTQLNVYFVVWTDDDADRKDPDDTGDLTITVETVTPTEISGEDDDVIVED